MAMEALSLSQPRPEQGHQMTMPVTGCMGEGSVRQLVTCPNSQEAGAEVQGAAEVLGPTAQWTDVNDLHQGKDEVMDLHQQLPFQWSKKIMIMIMGDQVLDLEAEEV